MKVLKMGNSEAENVITLALSLSCESCSRTFGEVQKLVQNNLQFRCQIVLTTSHEANNAGGQVARSILNLPNDQMEVAAQKWFHNIKQDQHKWKLNLGLTGDTEIDFQQINFHLRWLELAGVVSAPAIFLNKSEIPSIYGITNIEKLSQIAPNVGFANQQ
jgi:hypothetical protein